MTDVLTVPRVTASGPRLPRSRGPVSAAVITALETDGAPAAEVPVEAADPYGDDLQLALYVCYELHYRGFAGVAAEREWDPDLLRLRARMERRFLDAVRADVPGRRDVTGVLEELLLEPVGGTGLSYFLAESGTREQLREYAAQRSLYHLKEADPQAWVLPRLWGRAKAGLAAVEFDEYGGGRAERVHAQLFADLMTDLGLDPTYGRYLDAGCAEFLAVVNLMSLCGLHRALRGALVGHFAVVEITSSPASRRLAGAMRRAGAGPAAEFFYTEHVEADAVHEQVMRREVIDGLLATEPELEPDVAFGIEATALLEDRFGDRLVRAWQTGESSLRADIGACEGRDA